MPIRQRKTLTHPDAARIHRELVNEWSNPVDDESRPILIEEKPATPGRGIHLTVIWDVWGDLTQQERSEIIMDAYEETHSQDEALNVTVAMGLTKTEAKRMRIEYE
jgi:hypothetical protein